MTTQAAQITPLYQPALGEIAAVVFLNRKGRHTFADTAHELAQTYADISAEAGDQPSRYSLETLADVSHLLRELYRHALRAVRVYGAEFQPGAEQDPARIGFTLAERA